MQVLAYPHNVGTIQESFAEKRFCPEEQDNTTNSEEIDFTLKLSLDKPHDQNAEEKFLTRSSSIAGDITESLVPNGHHGGSPVPSQDKSRSLPAKAEKGLMQFEDLQTMRRAKNGKRLLLEKQNMVEAGKKEKYTAVSLPPPPVDDRLQLPPREVIAWAVASASNNPALNRALDKIKVDLNPSGESKHEGPRGLAEEEDCSSFLTSPKKEKDPMVCPETSVKEMPLRLAETMLGNPLKKVKLENSCCFEGDSMDTLR